MVLFGTLPYRKLSVILAVGLGWGGFGPIAASSARQLLIVFQAEVLRDEMGNQLTGEVGGDEHRLSAGTVVVCDESHSSRGKAAGERLRYVMTTESQPREGWISQRFTMPVADYAGKLAASRAAPNAEGESDAFYRPWLIRFQDNPAVLDAWDSVSQLIASNERMPADERLPDPYFARAAIWVAVENYADAIQDYITGIDLARKRGQAAEFYLPYVEKLAVAIRKLESNPVPVAGAMLGWQNAAKQHFALGYTTFFTGDYKECLPHFTNSITLDPTQPHYWYFRALTQRALGNRGQAQHDALLGVHFEQQLKEKTISMDQKLFRVQGERRTWLEKYRNGLMAFHLVGPRKVKMSNEAVRTSGQINAN